MSLGTHSDQDVTGTVAVVARLLGVPASDDEGGEPDCTRAYGMASTEPRPLRSDARRSLEQLVSDAAEHISRFSPAEALAATAAGAVMIDIRSQEARERHGVIPGSLHIPRTVLEWRVAVDSPWRNRYLGGCDQRLILVCDHGYSSILAASNLIQLGFDRTGDVIGGFESWKTMAFRSHPFDSDYPRSMPCPAPALRTEVTTVPRSFVPG